jgi:hypothetical protein
MSSWANVRREVKSKQVCCDMWLGLLLARIDKSKGQDTR